jgi:hypothetical protein
MLQLLHSITRKSIFQKFHCPPSIHLHSHAELMAPSGTVDGLNAIDKRFLKGKMCLVGSPELQNQEKRMEAAVMVENASVSLTVETSQL